MNEQLVVFSGGGTSGHVNPALAIADAMQAQHPERSVLFLGQAQGIEKELVIRAGYPFEAITAAALPTRLSWKMIRAAVRFWKGRRESRQLMKARRPLAVVGTGGYVCSPVVSAAASLKIPVLLHEQNAYPGRSNRLMARQSQAVCVAFPGTEAYFPHPDRVRVTGNPVRQAFWEQDRQAARQAFFPATDQPALLALGGSLGARSINEAVLGLAAWVDGRKAQGLPQVQVLLVAGRQHLAAVSQEAAAHASWLRVEPYLHDMPGAMAAADLIVSRSGALTCSELAAVGRPALLVPYPYAAGDHQTQNAQVLVQAGAARMAADAAFNADWLSRQLTDLLDQPARLRQMGQAAQALARPDAASAVVACLDRLIQP